MSKEVDEKMTAETTSDMYMEFSNEGEVPLNAFKLLGASTKRGVEGKIGFFGTGLKYAVALMLREEIPFKIFIGEKEVKFSVRKSNFGNIKVGVITVNGEKTSMTTDAGIDWEPWFAIREIYSNALDEGGTMELADKCNPEKGKTKIYIQMTAKLGDVSRNWQSYFSTKRKALDEISMLDLAGNSSLYRILSKRENQEFRLFRRGILVGRARNVNSLFDYDVSDIVINESRVIKYDWEGRQRAAEALAQTTNKEVLELFISSWRQPMLEHEERFWEYLFDDYRFRREKFSSLWKEVLQPYRLVPSDNTGFYGVTHKTIGLPNKLLKHLYEQFGDDLTIEGMSKVHYIVTGEFPQQFAKAYNILTGAGLIFQKSSIKTGKFRDYDVKGCWDSGSNEIILSDDSVNYDERSKLLLLMEEMLHAESKYSDNTREFEGFIMGKLLDKIMEGCA